ncbi:hypothetical protein GJW-30_1_00749 [Variibacter gotjawalensis]|uniref:Uncharacterized protein n=1 Tax=Variibacter gotjawalensis TaxID=1333996 RepID=A0A0S3PQH7_9BRAD|nr:hypothetical protein [Variibacter gotjawalensis]RZS50392.1 hypothetical protein EV661_2856 [Variibacter gotjawalensis]BAT58226.1 hypothetical protein GJW-30_1_00749 [Variibacter gotjawalensis]
MLAHPSERRRMLSRLGSADSGPAESSGFQNISFRYLKTCDLSLPLMTARYFEPAENFQGPPACGK